MKKTEIIGKMIGKRIEVVKADNKHLVGINGEVLDETRNMIVLKTKENTKKLIKKQVELKIK